MRVCDAASMEKKIETIVLSRRATRLRSGANSYFLERCTERDLLLGGVRKRSLRGEPRYI